MYGWHNKKTILAKRKHCCVMYTCYRLQPYWDYHCCAMIEQYIANKLAVLSQFVCLQCFVNRALSKYRNLSFSWNVHNRKETHNNIVSVIGRFTMMLRICANGTIQPELSHLSTPPVQSLRNTDIYSSGRVRHSSRVPAL
jgi:hypothetical protein